MTLNRRNGCHLTHEVSAMLRYVCAIVLASCTCRSTGFVTKSGSNPNTTLLFVDQSVVSLMDTSLSFELQRPVKGDRVISPTEPWESWAVFAYNHIVAGDGTRPHRLYYDCIEGDGTPPGETSSKWSTGKISNRRICLATSTDGLNFVKPNLGIFNRNGSTQNNILIEDSGVSVFLDTKPGVPDDERWKMVCSQSAYSSPDGLNWSKLPFTPTAEDDTKPTAYYDPNLGKYVIYVRRDVGGRRVGRCVTDNISDWQSESPNGCPIVFETDSSDPPDVDIYTNSYTPYPSIENPLLHILMPSFYFHFSSQTPWRFGNDGLLDIRFIVSHDGVKYGYTAASDSRSPYVPLGVNRCGESAHMPGVAEGWCSPTSGIEEQTSFDTSAMYMASGYVPSVEGDEIYFYASGQAMTHGGDGVNKTWGNQTGIRVLKARKDGFVAIAAPYNFSEIAPSFVTIPITIPTTCPPPVEKKINGSSGRITGCSYEHDDACPFDMPPVNCSTMADCQKFGNTLTCHGKEVSCINGLCQTGVVGGLLCASGPNTTRTTTSQGVVLRVNHITSVVGSVSIEVQENGLPVKGFELSSADALKGNSVDSIASWQDGQVASLSSLSGKTVSLKVALRDAKIFAISVGCY